MAIFKCKMCGGTLEINGEAVVTCDYCGTAQTLPQKSDEVTENLFNRANNLRLKSEFDKAEQVYEKILEIDDSEAEAHWGVVLCKYGIEYVEDPKTFKRIPTCHRTSYEAITANADYLAAIENADPMRRAIYEEEARAIDSIQKNILNIVKKEEPFDVFICYKETDAAGKRTIDSTIANDIYHQLTSEGFKVFYAAITLESKLGQEYEPYIFSALNSAKVMLVIGTKPEYFEAVWVKNEWSRYLKLMSEDRSRLLIPCYRDMDAYDLPEEFAHLQAQDMSKIGFINDVVRGIKKVISTSSEPAAAQAPQGTLASGNVNIAPLLERAFMFLEDGEFDRADEFCEQVLNQDPKNAQAYLGKLMAELKVKKQDELKDGDKSFDGNTNYQKTIRFADEKLKSTLNGYIEHINIRIENIRLERERNAEIARKKAECIAKRSKKIAIITTPIVCLIIAFVIVLNIAIIPNIKYNKAIALIESGDYAESYKLFRGIKGYRDSNEYISRFAICYDKRVDIDDEGEVTTWEYTYDSKGNWTKEKVTRSNGKVSTSTNTYTYDSEGNLIKEVSGSGYTDEYVYDGNGNLVKKISLSHNEIYSTEEYIYDSIRNLIQETNTHKSGSVSTIKYAYDNKGNLTKKTYKEDGDGYTYKYTYDSKGNKVKETITFSGGNSYVSEYVYDGQGKLTKKISTNYTEKYFYDSKGCLSKIVSDGYIQEYYGERIFYNP